MKYREEIDGLRAFAVIPVILFHAGFSLFSGGYVGVDVFFVISGNLITTLILSEKENGAFSLANFYERRARRIIPALFLVLLTSTLLAWFWLPPSQMKDFSRSLVAVSLFSSNILFWKDAGYWGLENELKPLLHTWSLGVEEQYYVFFPLLLMVMWRVRKRWILGSFLAIAAVSFLLSQWAAFNTPSANFFLLPTRAWELAIGAGIAFYFLYRDHIVRSLLSHKVVNELMSLLGLGLIGYAIFAFDEVTPFPSAYALVPTIGTALVIIFSSKDTFSGKLLGSKIFVAVGLISYSAYLWHQPLFAFARHSSIQKPSSALLAALSLASLLLAFFSWKYVEAPFRKQGVFSRRQIFSFSIAGSIAFITFGLIGVFTNGYQNRADPKLLAMLPASNKEYSDEAICRETLKPISDDIEYCNLIESDNNYVLLLGDSHAAVLRHQAKNALSKFNVGFISITKDACLPIKGIYNDYGDKEDCYTHNNDVYTFIVSNPKIEYVILVARWAPSLEETRFNNGEGGSESRVDIHYDVVKNAVFLYGKNFSHRREIAKRYADSIQELLNAGKKVILVYPIPEVGWNVPDYLARYYWLQPEPSDSPSILSTSFTVFEARNRRAKNALDVVPPTENLIRIFPEDLFCNNDVPGRCITHKDGVIFYKDDDHLSEEGASILMERIVRRLNFGDSGEVISR